MPLDCRRGDDAGRWNAAGALRVIRRDAPFPACFDARRMGPPLLDSLRIADRGSLLSFGFSRGCQPPVCRVMLTSIQWWPSHSATSSREKSSQTRTIIGTVLVLASVFLILRKEKSCDLRLSVTPQVEMDSDQLRGLLEQVHAGAVDVDAALDRLRHLPFEDLGYAKLDHHRLLRHGLTEVVFRKGQDARADRRHCRAAARTSQPTFW